MHHTIYFGQKPLILASSAEEAHAYARGSENFLIEADISKEGIRKLIPRLENPETAGAALIHPDPEQSLEALKTYFEFIQAAGGLVWSHEGPVLLIFRKGKWDLPKGKLDPGEDLASCALREVEEETGLRQITLGQALCRTYHTYYQDGKPCLKESHWYLMRAPQQNELKPQLEEDIEQCVWIAPADLEPYLANTHRSVADVLQAALPMLLKG